jgi:hypothetical protein
MITIPVVHMNGTSRAELLDQARKAHEAAENLRAALRAMTPHGRDYYPKGNQLINTALDQHHNRLIRVEAIQEEIEKIWEGIFKQGE